MDSSDKLKEDEMIKAVEPETDDEPKVEEEGAFKPNEAWKEPKTASGQDILEHTKDGYDIRAEEEEDPAAKPPPNDGPEDPAADSEKPKDGKKPPFGKKPDDEDAPDGKKKPFGKKDASEYLTVAGGALKALGDGRVGGYLVSFGNSADADLSGEYFDKATNFHFDDGYPVKGEPLMYHHGLDKTLGVKRIGVIDKVTMDEAGIWAEGVLNQRDAYEKAIYKLAQEGKLSYSSGALPQGVVTSRSGHIEHWPIIEGSLTPMPMQPFKTTIIPVKALPEVEDLFSAAVATEPETPESRKAIPSEGEPTMTLLQERMVDAVLSAFASAANVTLTPDELASVRKSALEAIGKETGDDDQKTKDYTKSAEFIDLVENLVRQTTAQDDVAEAVKARIAAKSTPQPKAQGFRDDSRISVRSKYHNLSAPDMAFLAIARKGHSLRMGEVWQEDNYLPEMVEKAQKALGEDKINVGDSSMKSLLGVKSNELHNTGNTGYGAEWVADLWSSDLWLRERMENVVASRIRTIELPSDPYTLPLESTDPTIYHVPETTAETQLALDNANTPIPDSLMGTKNLTITTEKIGGRVMFSTEIIEDSIIPFVPQLRGQLMRSIADSMDYTILHGDTSIGTANVSYKGGTTVATQVFTTMNGIRKHALAQVNGTINQNGTVTLAALRTLRFKLPNALAVNIANLVMFVDVQTYGKMLSLDELNIWYLNGRNATVNTGTVPMIDGIPVIPSDQMTLVDSTGYIPSAGNGTLGNLILLPLNQWIMGYRRRVNATVEFLSYYDSYQLTATARVGMVNRDAATAINAGYMYNITVT